MIFRKRRDGREINIMPIKIFGDYQFVTIGFSQNNTIWTRLLRVYRLTKAITSELSKVNIHFELFQFGWRMFSNLNFLKRHFFLSYCPCFCCKYVLWLLWCYNNTHPLDESRLKKRSKGVSEVLTDSTLTDKKDPKSVSPKSVSRSWEERSNLIFVYSMSLIWLNLNSPTVSITGYNGEDAAGIAEDGLRTPVRWKGGASLLPSDSLVRLDIRFAGIRPEDCRLHAVYVVGQWSDIRRISFVRGFERY